MAQALTYFMYIYRKALNFVFNEMTIDSSVTVGWVMVSIIVFGILMGSILNIPHRIGNFSNYGTQERVSGTYYDGDGFRHTIYRRYNRKGDGYIK